VVGRTDAAGDLQLEVTRARQRADQVVLHRFTHASV
jgi:hypothetical protein